MLLIGLTGGIGSGKSTVAAHLAQRGWFVVDADKIAREVVEPGQPALQELAQAFGADILDATGALRRAELAQRAFASTEATQILNAITHPRIQQRTQELFASASHQGARYCVYDMPLLVDNGLDREMDEVIVVDVAEEERVRRLVAHRGLTEVDARRRIAQQVDDATRLAAASFVIDNNGPLEDLKPQVDRVADAIELKAS